MHKFLKLDFEPKKLMTTRTLLRQAELIRAALVALTVFGYMPGFQGIPYAQGQSVASGDAIVTVDFSRKDGKIRALNGANLAPPLAVQASGLNLNTSYKALKIPYARLHDVPLDNPGMRLVDIQHIFGNWEADASDPKNYYFEQTDDYIRNCRELGTDIIFRLGTSIEHSVNHYYAHPPKDFEKWTEICLNIIRHYNDGWANGHHWNIRYWEIWNEPNIKRQMWSGTMEDYYRLYVTSAKRIKSEFPDLKVGGPALSGLSEELIVPFIKHCREHDAPLDFLSWHFYGTNLGNITTQPARAREWLDREGFLDTELHLNEWHYFPANFVKLNSDRQYRRNVFEGPDGCNGIDAATFIAAVLTEWQDTPLTMGHYYTATGVWGFGLFNAIDGIPYKTYYGMLAFAKMLDHPLRVATGSEDQSIKVLAGMNASGAKAILVSAFKSDAKRIFLDLKEVDRTGLEVLKIDRENDWIPVETKYENGRIILDKPSGSCVFLVSLQE